MQKNRTQPLSAASNGTHRPHLHDSSGRTTDLSPRGVVCRNTIPVPDWNVVYRRLKGHMEASGVTVESRELGPHTTGIFDGVSITTNSDCDVETRCHNLGLAFGHIVQWSIDAPQCQALYDALYAAKSRRDADPVALESALEAFREYEVEASRYAAWILLVTGNAAALRSFTLFARADIEAIVTYHRTGIAPIWNDFFADWRGRAERGEFEVDKFVPKAIRRFTPLAMEPQEVIQAVREGSAS
jgi:hypothetical protein